MPLTAGFFATGMFAIAGLPPFGLFISEFALIRAGFAAGRVWLMGVVLVLLVVAFIALIRSLNRMLYGAPPADATPIGESEAWALVPLGLCLLIVLALGLVLPRPIGQLLNEVVKIVSP